MKRKLIASLICGALLTSTASVSAMTAETELKLETMAYFKPVYDTLKEQQIRFDYELEHGNPYDAKDILAAMQASVAKLRNDMTSQQLDSDIQTAQMKLIETELKMRNSLFQQLDFSERLSSLFGNDNSIIASYTDQCQNNPCNLSQELSLIVNSMDRDQRAITGYLMHYGFKKDKAVSFLLKLLTESQYNQISLNSIDTSWEELGYDLSMIKTLRKLVDDIQQARKQNTYFQWYQYAQYFEDTNL